MPKTAFIARHRIATVTAAALLSFAFSACASAGRDRDNNPPGPAGGPGTNWENPPGWKGGPGASPDRRYRTIGGTRYEFVLREGYYFNPSFGYYHPNYGRWNQVQRCWWDNDGNPPGPAGGPGTNWENPPGWPGGPGASPDRYGRCR